MLWPRKHRHKTGRLLKHLGKPFLSLPLLLRANEVTRFFNGGAQNAADRAILEGNRTKFKIEPSTRRKRILIGTQREIPNSTRVLRRPYISYRPSNLAPNFRDR